MTQAATRKAKRLIIVWHSRTGTAQALARAAADGARSAGATDSARSASATGGARSAGATGGGEPVTVDLRRAEDTDADSLLAADGYIFVGPENLAGLSGAMKEMVDRHYYALIDQVAGRPWALIIAAGTDGEGAVRQWQRIATGWRLKAVADPMIVRTGADRAETIWATKTVPEKQLAEARDLGMAMASGLAMGVF